MCNNRDRYEKEREARWGMARKGEQLAIEATHRVEELSGEQIRNYISNLIRMPI